MIEKNFDRKQIELVTKYDTNDAQKESLVGGPSLRRGIYIRYRIWTGGVQNPLWQGRRMSAISGNELYYEL